MPARMASSESGTAPGARAWTSTLPRAVASTGPATTSRPVASAVSWQSSSFCEPPPTTWMTSTSAPASSAAWSDGAGVAGGQRVEDAAHRRRRLHPRCTGRGRDPRRHVARRDERGVVDVDRRSSADRRRRPRPAGRRGRRAPLPQALLEQPEPADVAEEPGAAVDAELVGEVRRPGRFGEDGRVELQADERPRSAGDVGEAVGRRRHADDRRCGVVRADGHDRDTVRRLAPDLARCLQRREAGRRERRAGRADRSTTSPRADVEEPGRRGVGELGSQLAGEPVGRAGRGSAAAWRLGPKRSARRPAGRAC